MQNSNLTYSVEFLLDLTQIQVRETISGVFLARMDIPIQVTIQAQWTSHSKAHGGGDAKGFQRTSHHASTHHREPTWRKAIDGGSGEHVGMSYYDTPDRFVGQTVDNFLLPWVEAGSGENLITLDEDDRFSETKTSPAPQQPPAMELRADHHSIDSSLITLKNYNVWFLFFFFVIN